jgi:hypothetical protein
MRDRVHGSRFYYVPQGQKKRSIVAGFHRGIDVLCGVGRVL